jgi:hypothetical protein
MRVFDVFNGDADGLIARHQYRLANPLSDAPTLITGVKRDIDLLRQVNASAGDQVNVFDISWDRNTDAAAALLAAGVTLRYFDHHRACVCKPHPGLESFIDEAPDLCTSLIVNRHLQGTRQRWAVAGAFGDNLHDAALTLANRAAMSEKQINQLRQLGECLNYNAYGDSVADLYYPPATLAMLLLPYEDPFDFIAGEEVLARLAAGYAEDLVRANVIAPIHTNEATALYLLPNENWSRRVSGVFANHLVHHHPKRAHAVVTPDRIGTATVSIRAPLSHTHGANEVAQRFGGGGRAAAAGIENLALTAIPQLIAAMEQVFAHG